MGVRLAVPAMLALGLAAGGQTGSDATWTLNRTRNNVVAWRERLRNYTCVETVNRTYYRRAKPPTHMMSCDEIEGARRAGEKMVVDRTDRLRLDVKVSEGNEIASWAGASRFRSVDFMQTVKGPYGTGPFGTILGEIFIQPGVKFEFGGTETIGGKTMWRYRFQVPLGSSHYMVAAGVGNKTTPYSGEIWVDPQTFGMRRLRVQTAELPWETGACEADTEVSYEERPAASGDYLLARRSELDVLMRDTREDKVESEYSKCREYLGEARMVSGPEEAGEEAGPKREAAALPPGVRMEIELTAPIDSDTAAAGDVFTARVRRDARDMDGKVVVRAGARVRGRIVNMEHRMDDPRYYRFGLELETVETVGGEAAVYAVPRDMQAVELIGGPRRDLAMRNPSVYLRPEDEPEQEDDLVFPTYAKKKVIRKGYRMKWETEAGPVE